jgi:hypothetical protein
MLAGVSSTTGVVVRGILSVASVLWAGSKVELGISITARLDTHEPSKNRIPKHINGKREFIFLSKSFFRIIYFTGLSFQFKY